jgi:hypothetical protein
MDTSTLLGSVGLALSICGIIYSAINHRHIRLRLCNRSYDFSIDVDSTETKNTESEEKNTENKDIKNKQENEKNIDKKNKQEKDTINTLVYTPHNFKIQPLKFDI